MESSVNKSVDIAAFIALIHFEPGTLFEVRILNVGPKKRTYAGYFTDPAKAALAIKKFDVIHKPAGIYVSLNPVTPGKKIGKKTDYIKSEETGKRVKVEVEFEFEIEETNSIVIVGFGAQMKNDDAVKRNWFFVDIDPDRKPGTSSTEKQMLDSIGLGDKIESDLALLGWPKPLRAMSGNGAYLIYRTDEDNNEENNVLLRDCLYALIQKYSPHVLLGEKKEGLIGLDKLVHNSARIAKAIGTFARKGIHSEDKPHRQSWFAVPDGPIEAVPTQLLKDLAATRKDAGKVSKRKASTGSTGLIRGSCGSRPPADDPEMKEWIAETRADLKKIPVKFAIGRRCDGWSDIGMALHWVHDSLYEDFVEFSKSYPEFTEKACSDLWNSLSRTGDPDKYIKSLKRFIPNEFEIGKHIQERLSDVLDPDNEDQRLRALNDCLLWNKNQKSPMDDGLFANKFRNLWRVEQKRRSVKGSSAFQSEPTNGQPCDENPESELPPMPVEVSKVVNSIENSISKIETKEILTEDDTQKINRLMGNQHRAMARSVLSPAVESLVSSWQLYRADEDPPVLTLEFYDSLSEKRHRVDLSPEQLLSYMHSSAALIRQTLCRLPDSLAKPWRSVVNYLIDNQKVVEGNKHRDVTAAVARHILYTCLRGVHSVEVIKNFQNKNSVLHSEVVFRQGNPKFPDAFWFKFDSMFLEVNENFRDSKITRANISKLMHRCGATNKYLPRHWTIRHERMMHLDSNAFRSLCEIAGVEWTMGDFAGNDNTHPSSEKSINKSFDSDSTEWSTNATDTATRHNIDDTEFKYGYLDQH